MGPSGLFKEQEEIAWSFDRPTDLSDLGEIGEKFERLFSLGDLGKRESSESVFDAMTPKTRQAVELLLPEEASAVEEGLKSLIEALSDGEAIGMAKKAAVAKLPELYSLGTEFFFASRALHAARASRAEWASEYDWRDDAFGKGVSKSGFDAFQFDSFRQPCSDAEIMKISYDYDDAAKRYQTAAFDVAAIAHYAARGLRLAPSEKIFEVARELQTSDEFLLERFSEMGLFLQEGASASQSVISENARVKESKELLKEARFVGEIRSSEESSNPEKVKDRIVFPDAETSRNVETAGFVEMADFFSEQFWDRYDASETVDEKVNFVERSELDKLALTIEALNLLHVWASYAYEKPESEQSAIGPKMSPAKEAILAEVESIVTAADLKGRLDALRTQVATTLAETLARSKVRGSTSTDLFAGIDRVQIYDRAVAWKILHDVFSRSSDWTEDPFGFVVCALHLPHLEEKAAAKSPEADRLHVETIAALVQNTDEKAYRWAGSEGSKTFQKEGRDMKKSQIMSEFKKILLERVYTSFIEWANETDEETSANLSRWEMLNTETVDVLKKTTSDGGPLTDQDRAAEILRRRETLLRSFLLHAFGKPGASGAWVEGMDLAKLLLAKHLGIEGDPSKSEKIKNFQKVLVDAKLRDTKQGHGTPSIVRQVAAKVACAVCTVATGVALPAVLWFGAGLASAVTVLGGWPTATDADVPSMPVPAGLPEPAKQIEKHDETTFCSVTLGSKGQYEGLTLRSWKGDEARAGLVTKSELKELASEVEELGRNVAAYIGNEGDEKTAGAVRDLAKGCFEKASSFHDGGGVGSRSTTGAMYLAEVRNDILAKLRENAEEEVIRMKPSSALVDVRTSWKDYQAFGLYSQVSPFAEENFPSSGAASVLYSPGGAYFKNYDVEAAFRLRETKSTQRASSAPADSSLGSLKVRATTLGLSMVGLGLDACVTKKLSVTYCKNVIDQLTDMTGIYPFLDRKVAEVVEVIEGREDLPDVKAERLERYGVASNEFRRKNEALMSKLASLGTMTWRTITTEGTALLYAKHYELVARSDLFNPLAKVAFVGCSALVLRENYHRISKSVSNWRICKLASGMFSAGASSSATSSPGEELKLSRTFGSAFRMDARTWTTFLMGGMQVLEAVSTGNYARAFASVFIGTTTSLLSAYATYLKEMMDLANELTRSATEASKSGTRWDDKKMKNVRDELTRKMNSSWRADFVRGLKKDVTAFLDGLDAVRKMKRDFPNLSEKQTTALLAQHKEELRELLAVRSAAINYALSALAVGSTAITAHTFWEAASKDSFLNKDQALFLKEQSELTEANIAELAKSSLGSFLEGWTPDLLKKGAAVVFPRWLAEVVVSPFYKFSASMGARYNWLSQEGAISTISYNSTNLGTSFRYAMAGSSLVVLSTAGWKIVELAPLLKDSVIALSKTLFY